MAQIKGRPVIADASGVSGESSPQERARAVSEQLEFLRRAAISNPPVRDETGRVTKDSFQNFMLRLGQNTGNAVFDGSTYGFNPITRIRTLLEWIHRGSWLGGVAVDLVADDMTRAGVDITSPLSPRDAEAIGDEFTELGLWNAFNDAQKWARLYGGSLLVILIDGEDLAQPLRIETIGKDTFRGLACYDRWAVEPDLSHPVTDLGPYLGDPKYYKITQFGHGLIGQVIHYSRVIRLEGIRLPYWQRVMENGWGISVLERLYDRMVAFDAATMGAAQLVHKSYLRVFKINKLRELAAAEGELLQQFSRYVDVMRRYQGQEGMTMIDAEDEFQVENRSGFTGIPEALMQFGQQLAGALQIPLVRLFGMSPAGFSATGESDLRTYYDGIQNRQEKDWRVGLRRIFHIIAKSKKLDLGDSFNFAFRPLWQLTEEAKAAVAGGVTSTINQGFELGVIDKPTALREMRDLSRRTGVWSNITEEMIQRAKDEPPPQFGEGPPAPEEFGAEGGEGEGEGEGERPKFPELPRPPGATSISGQRPRLHLLDRDSHYVAVHGLPIFVETPRGEPRRGLSGWSAQMPCDYGFIPLTGSAEGPAEGFDVYLGPDLDAPTVWVMNQLDPETGEFDEEKAFIGYRNRAAALADYQAAFADNTAAARMGAVRKMGFDQFKAWLEERGYRAPLRTVAA